MGFPLLLLKATEEELQAAGRPKPPKPVARSSAKSKAKKPPSVSAPSGVMKTIDKKSPKGKEMVPKSSEKGKNQEPSAASQPPPKRLRGKTSEMSDGQAPDQAAELAKVQFGWGVPGFGWS